MMLLREEIMKLQFVEKAGVKLRNFEDLLVAVKKRDTWKIDENLSLNPFYVVDNGVSELYDYELQICVVDKSNISQIILNRTGKDFAIDIPPKLLEKAVQCSIEIVRPNANIETEKLVKYFEYLFRENNPIELIKQNFYIAKKEKFYFEFYIEDCLN